MIDDLRGLIADQSAGPFLAAMAALKLRIILGYERTVMSAVQTLLAAVIMGLWIAPGLVEMWEFGPSMAATVAVFLGVVARPLWDGVLKLAVSFRDDPFFFISPFIKRKDDK